MILNWFLVNSNNITFAKIGQRFFRICVLTIYKNFSENAFKEGVVLHNSGVSIDDVKKAYIGANDDGNKYISEDEAIAYPNSTNYTRAQKRAIFDALMANPKTKNPN